MIWNKLPNNELTIEPFGGNIEQKINMIYMLNKVYCSLFTLLQMYKSFTI